MKPEDASSSTSGYGTFYPESSSTFSAPPTPAPTSIKTESYQSMPPPADQQSPYSYGYGDEKKKMLIQGPGEGQTDFSMFSTAYPSSVTGGRGYSGHGGLKGGLERPLLPFKVLKRRLVSSQAGESSRPGRASRGSRTKASEVAAGARTLDTTAPTSDGVSVPALGRVV